MGDTYLNDDVQVCDTRVARVDEEAGGERSEHAARLHTLSRHDHLVRADSRQHAHLEWTETENVSCFNEGLVYTCRTAWQGLTKLFGCL